MKNWNQSWKVGIALFIKQQKHLNRLFWKLWQTAQNILYYRHILSYPLGPINDNKEPSFGICRVKPCESLTGRILHKCTNPTIRIWSGKALLRYREISVQQLGYHDAGENQPSLGFYNRQRNSLYNERLANGFYYYHHHVFSNL